MLRGRQVYHDARAPAPDIWGQGEPLVTTNRGSHSSDSDPYPSSNHDKAHRALVNPQENSPFFHRLPLEIRQLIYVHFLKGLSRTIHVVRMADYTLAHFRCRDGACNSVESNKMRRMCWGASNESHCWTPDLHRSRTDGGSLDLLVACRQM